MGSPSAYIVKGRSALTRISRARMMWTAGESTWVPLNTFGSSSTKRRRGDRPVMTTSSSPSSSLASGATYMPPP